MSWNKIFSVNLCNCSKQKAWIPVDTQNSSRKPDSSSLAQEEHGRRVTCSIGGRNIPNLEFADDIDALAEEEQKLEALVESLDKTCTKYKMEISAEKTRLMTNSANGILSILREIKVKWQNLGTVQASSTLEQLFHMMAPNQRFSQGLHKPLQLFQS